MGIIRIILALCVVVWHVPGEHARLLNAAIAVLLFFVISGFYMALVVNEKYAPSGAGWIRRFYTARFLRLYPAYGLMCLGMIALYWFTRSPNAFTMRLPISAGEQALIAAINVSLIGQDLYELMNHVGAEQVRALFSPGFFNPRYMLVGQAWSLSSELAFYLLVPLVVLWPMRIVALLAASLAVRIVLIGGLGFESGVWGYWFVPASMCMFALGSLSYSLYRVINGWRWAAPIGWSALAGIVGWLAWRVVVDRIVLPVDATDNLDLSRFWAAYLIFVTAVPFVFVATKNVEIDRKIGDLSYPLYLVHGVLLGILFSRSGVSPGNLKGVMLGVAVSLLGAIILRGAELAIEWMRELLRLRRLVPVLHSPRT